MATREQILEQIGRQKHLAPLVDGLARWIAPAVKVTAKNLAGKRVAPMGASRFGGLADLPRGATWPTAGDIPLTFVGQIDLRDVAPFSAAKQLPKRGLLSFFFDGLLTGYSEGQSPDRSRVVFTDAKASALARIEPPEALAGYGRASAASASFAEEWTLPEAEELDGVSDMIPPLEPILLTTEQRDAYQKLRRKLRGKYIGSRLFGHPDAVQGGEVKFDAIVARDGGARFRYEDYAWTQQEMLVDEMRDLVLLFQAASGKGEPWDSGVIYFWIRRQDLKSRRFDRAFARFVTT